MDSGPGYELGDMWNFSFIYDSDLHIPLGPFHATSAAVDATHSMDFVSHPAEHVYTFESDEFFFGLLVSGDLDGIMSVAGSYDLFNMGYLDIIYTSVSDAFSMGYYFDYDPAYSSVIMNVTAVPAPGVLALLGLAAGMTRRRRRG